MRTRLAFIIGLFLLFALPCAADSIVPVKSIPLSGSIKTTNTFQLIQGETNNRIGCTVQNNGTHTMYVFFGPIAGATTAGSATLLAGQSINCFISDVYVLKSSVSINGTSGDAYFANFQ